MKNEKTDTIQTSAEAAASAAEPAQPDSERAQTAGIAGEDEELTALVRMDRARQKIMAELADAGARSPELIFEMMKPELQFGPDGGVENAVLLTARLRAKYPEQFIVETRVASIDAAALPSSQRRLTKEALSKMTPAEIAKLDWSDVRRVLASG